MLWHLDTGGFPPGASLGLTQRRRFKGATMYKHEREHDTELLTEPIITTAHNVGIHLMPHEAVAAEAYRHSIYPGFTLGYIPPIVPTSPTSCIWSCFLAGFIAYVLVAYKRLYV